ncbi:MAG: phosphoribosylformylglycinamidine cyclo-ligase [bacterium]|nr:MAG: phosphoribosylformylglycinamidine cyclo-ligase [bacterium]
MQPRYRESGVDIDAANLAMGRIGELVSGTWGSEVLSRVGNFGGLYAMPDGLESPVLVSSVDGVGTKLKVAFMADRHDTVGEDLVNHCINDILVQGAEPLFFLDYIACGKLHPDVIVDIVRGLSKGCRENGCALIGGETAEMPGFYAEGEYDLVGCVVGVVERKRIIDGSSIVPGDSVWAFPSNGLHTNGYSLARKILFEEQGLTVSDTLAGTASTVGEVLLAVHRSYLPEVRSMAGALTVKGLAHITGGGLLENIPRILPDGCAAEIDTTLWKAPPVFEYLEKYGRIERLEMFRVFNMGVGMVCVVGSEDDRTIGTGDYRWKPFRIGTIVPGERDVRLLGID